jgi:iron complex outermembrane receptor protein
MKISLFATSALALACFMGGQARAQQGAQANGAPAAQPVNQLGEVIVTATRREQNVQKLALPITAVGSEKLRDAGVVNPQDLDKLVAGVSLTPNGSTTQVFIRGVGTYAILQNAESAVAFNVDGVYMGLPALINGNFFDLDRVEVLKGPQGTLYGRNASAGAINVISAKPAFNHEADATFEVGNYGLVRAEGGANMPINDMVALRLSTQIINRSGYFTDGSGDDKEESVRAQVLFKPTDRLTANLSYTFFEQHGFGNGFVASPYVNASNPWIGASTTLGNSQIQLARQDGAGRGVAALNGRYPPGSPFALATQPAIETHTNSVHGQVDYDFGPAVLTVLAAYNQLQSFSNVQPGFTAQYNAAGHQESVEARLASPAGAKILHWVAGVYAYGYNVDSTATVLQGVSNSSALGPGSNQDKTYAGFGEATWSITDALRLTGGLRYSSETVTGISYVDPYSFTASGVISPTAFFGPGGTTPPTVVSGVVNGKTISFSEYPQPSETYKSTNYKAGVEYDLTPTSMVFANVSTGYKAGGIILDSAPGAEVLRSGQLVPGGLLPNTIQPEKLTAYTVGAKNKFLDGRLRANVDIFYWDYLNHQETPLLPQNNNGLPSPRIINVGKSKLQGVNFDLGYLVTPDDVVSAQIEYLDATFTNFKYSEPIAFAPIQGVSTGCTVTPQGVGNPLVVPAVVDCSGKPFVRAPKWTGVLGYQHTFHLEAGAKVVFGANSTLTSPFWVATDYVPGEYQKSAAITDLDLTYKAPANWSAQIYVRNVGNAAVKSGAFEEPFIPGLAYVQLRPPRTYGMQFRYNF